MAYLWVCRSETTSSLAKSVTSKAMFGKWMSGAVLRSRGKVMGGVVRSKGIRMDGSLDGVSRWAPQLTPLGGSLPEALRPTYGLC